MGIRMICRGIVLSLVFASSLFGQAAFTVDKRSGFSMSAHGALASNEYVIGGGGCLSYRGLFDLDFSTYHTVASANDYSAIDHAEFSFSSFVLRLKAAPWRVLHGSALFSAGALAGYEYQNYGEQFQQPNDYLSARDFTIKYIHTGLFLYYQQPIDGYVVVPQAEIARLFGRDGFDDVVRYELSLALLMPTSPKNAVSFGFWYQGTDQVERPNVIGAKLTFHGWNTPADKQ